MTPNEIPDHVEPTTSTRRTVSTWPALVVALGLVGLAYVLVVALAGP